MRTSEKLGLAALIAAGAILRYGGMSHDLHEGKVYHPDTPKQIRAIQSFYAGQYFQHIGHRDYDGYPLFNSHLVEYACRILEPARRAVLHMVGVPVSEDALLDWGVLYWLTLILNATLSTVAIAVVYRIGRENFTPVPAFVAALLQTLSPIDVTACHYATGDTTAAFFSTVSLLYAFRICRLGRRRDYALAAAAAVFGFAAKYHAGMAVFPIVAAHIARTGKPAAWFKPDSLARVGWTAAAAVVALFLSIPSLFSHFGITLSDTIAALGSSSSRVPPELREAGRLDKFVFSMKTNLPVLYRILGPAAPLALAAGLLTRLRRQAAVYILLGLPVMYFALGVGSKTLVHPVYHAVMTAPVFLLAAFCFVRRLPPDAKWRVPAYAGSAALMVWTVVFLARGAGRELFFQWHMDTRRMSARWVQENVPASFDSARGRYTFPWDASGSSGSVPPGTLYARGRLGPLDVPGGAVPLKRFILERDPLMQFRNVGIETFLGRTSLLRPGFSLPVNQRWPSRTGNHFDFANGLQFYQSERLFTLAPGRDVAKWLVAEVPLREAWLIVRNGSLPAWLKASFGGADHQVRLRGRDSAVIPIASPRARFPSGEGLHFYKLEAGCDGGRVCVLLATKPGEAGRMLFNLGRYAEAAPLLIRGAKEESDPAAAAQAVISARLAGLGQVPDERVDELAGRVPDVGDEDSLFDVYGIRSAYLDALAFVRLGPSEFVVEGFGRVAASDADDEEDDAAVSRPRVVRPRKQERFFAATPELMLDPGHYIVSVDLRAVGAEERPRALHAQVTDVRGQVLSEQRLSLPPLKAAQFTSVKFKVVVPTGVPEVRIVLVARERVDLAIGGMELRPGPLANAMALAAVLRLVKEGDGIAAAGEPMAYDALMAVGRERAKDAKAEDAADCFAAAAALRPLMASPVTEIARLWPALSTQRQQAMEPLKRRADEMGKGGVTVPADVVFDGGIRLTRVVLREPSVARGGKLGLNLHWEMDRDRRGGSRPEVWVHFVDGNGRVVFQGDRDMERDLRLPVEPAELSPFFNEVKIRPTVPAGEYRIRMGLYYPSSRTTVKILSSKLLPVEKSKRVVLPQRLVVTEG